MKKMVKFTLVVLFIFMLSGCSSMNSNYDCPNKAGVRCKSLDQINGMVDRGEIRSHLTNESTVFSTSSEPSIHAELETFHSYPLKAVFKAGNPIRYGETVQRIWITPYEDTEHNYHDEHYIYTVMNGGHWIGEPVKTIHVQE